MRPVNWRRDWQQAKAAAEAVDELPLEQQRDFQARQAALTDLHSRRDHLLEQRGRSSLEVAHTDTDLIRLASEIKQQELRLYKAKENSRQIERALQAQQVFEAYRQELKKSRRQEIETELNTCFQQLMTSHHLVERITLGDDFDLNYRDTQGRDIGVANISAGMKQLTAQALLWALSVVSKNAVPVIVDTPLARIDRLHQENLLANYYPKAALQVIVLPTDSEIDREKYALLKPFIGAEFKLENADGDRTQVVSGTAMYDLERA